jgi:hypothetical protein
MKGGHLTLNPENSKYTGVVSCESVRIALTYAVLHRVKSLTVDIRDAYLQVATSEKHVVICGHEFGLETVGKQALVV